MGVSRAATEYYLAEGTTRDGYDTWFTIQNPGDNCTNVQIDLMYPDGKVQTRSLYVNPHTRVTLSVDDMVDGPCDIAATIKAGSPIVVERPMYFDYHGWTGGHNTSAYGPEIRAPKRCLAQVLRSAFHTNVRLNATQVAPP